MLKMPPRQETDGMVCINRIGEDRIGIEVVDDGKSQSMGMSRYNAWRVFGMLSVFLEIPLPASTSKAISLGEKKDFSATIGPDKPLKSLGDKVAHNLQMKLMQEELAKQGITLTPVVPAVPRSNTRTKRKKK